MDFLSQPRSNQIKQGDKVNVDHNDLRNLKAMFGAHECKLGNENVIYRNERPKNKITLALPYKYLDMSNKVGMQSYIFTNSIFSQKLN